MLSDLQLLEVTSVSHALICLFERLEKALFALVLSNLDINQLPLKRSFLDTHEALFNFNKSKPVAHEPGLKGSQ